MALTCLEGPANFAITLIIIFISHIKFRNVRNSDSCNTTEVFINIINSTTNNNYNNAIISVLRLSLLKVLAEVPSLSIHTTPASTSSIRKNNGILLVGNISCFGIFTKRLILKM